MSENRWLATGNFFTSYKAEQRIFHTHIDRVVFLCFLVLMFAWPLIFKVGNKYMLVIDSILIAIVAVYGLNLLTGFAGLISIGHAAFVGVGAYTLATFARLLGGDHVLLTHFWPLMIIVAGLVGAVIGGIVGLPSLRLKHLYLVIATLSFQMIFQWFINFSKFYDQGQTIAIGRVFWFTGRACTEGVENHRLDGVDVRVYGAAKTVADCFKYRNKLGIDTAVEALKLFLRDRRGSPEELTSFARVCRVERVMRPYIEAIL